MENKSALRTLTIMWEEKARRKAIIGELWQMQRCVSMFVHDKLCLVVKAVYKKSNKYPTKVSHWQQKNICLSMLKRFPYTLNKPKGLVESSENVWNYSASREPKRKDEKGVTLKVDPSCQDNYKGVF